MKIMTTLRFIAFWLCMLPLFCTAQDSRYDDSLALVALYNATDGVHWTNTWDDLTQPMDDWYGVTLDENGRVTCIDMDGVANCGGSYDTLGNNLSGNIPPEIGNLTNLEKLSLMNNQINSSIPSEIGNLTNLTELFLRANQISGSIPPEIGNLSSLIVLQLEHNQLSDSIPPEIGNLNSLSYLSLAGNELTGSIPPEIENLNNLSELRLWGNELSGSIPMEIWNLSNLGTLMLSGNKLTGSIPSEITNLEHLVNLSLAHNHLSGCYDDSLLSLCSQLPESSSTNTFISDGNGFVMAWEDFCSIGGGCTPCRQSDSLALVALYESTDGANWENTWDLTLPMDTWYGISINLSGCVTCIDMDGGSNDCYADYSDNGNNLSGNLPPEIGNLKSLDHLILMNNQLTGSIPSEIGGLEQLISLLMGGNQLSSNIPEEIGNLVSLLVMNLAVNQLSGNIPTTIGNLDNLSNLQLWSNQLTGDIPMEICSLSNLGTLNLSDNQLTGSIPPEIENLTKIHTLRLRYNQLTGGIPSEITNLEHLVNLSLAHNHLSGCYDDSLLSLCSQLSESSSTNTSISDGNDFVMAWEDFCSIGGGCTPCRQSDSLALVALYESTDGANWTNTWDLTLPMDTWYGISINLSGCVTCIDMDGGDNDCYGNYFDDGNNLSGNIPSAIGDLKSLKDLNLMNNQLTGSIPSEIGGVEQLISLLMGGNQLSGNIPEEIGNLANLRVMNLAVNQLSGNIPPTIGNLENLSNLQLWSNQLTGDIPMGLWNLSNLSYLALSDNKLTGNIPPEIVNLTNIQILRISYNQLTGSIPSEMTNLNKLTDLRLPDNQLTGNIPDFSSSLKNLYLQKNKFSYDEIEALYDSNSFDEFEYSPQYHGEVQPHIVALDTTLTLELSTPLPGNNNQNVSYQWKRNDDTLVAAVDSIYLINNLQLSDVGKYTLHTSDSLRVPDLEVISEPIYVIIPGYDLLGQLVEYNQLMIEFDDWQDKIDYETNHLLPNAAVLADSCSCNRLLYLWQFPNDSIAFQTLLDIDTRKEPQTRRGRIDGGFNNILGIGPIPGTQGWTWTSDYPHSYPNSVSIFLIDSGTDVQNWDATPYLDNNAPRDNCYNTPPCLGYDYTTDTLECGFVDSIGHGTFGMRSIAEDMDVYMNMNVVPLKVFNQDGQGTLFNFICALYHAIDHGADIINISAGYSGQASSILEEAIAQAHAQFIVTATGNEGVNIDSFPQYPAYYAKPFYKIAYDGSDSLVHYNNVISVAALNALDSLWQYSNYGNEAATVSAYGENMGGYSHTGDEVSYSGTSISTYYVTRQLAAEIARDKTRSLEDIWMGFDTLYLRDCPATTGLTSTGKCLDISLSEVYSDLRVFLEGAFDATSDTMRTDLNTLRHILPGQIDSTLNDTLAMHPYHVSPFDYHGTESVPSTFDNYPPEVVDWVLISARTEISANTTVNRTAAWLLKDGRVQLLKPLFEELATAPDSVYIVVEHRNHIGIMSPQKLPIERNVVAWDFTTQNSYTATGEGQVMLNNLYWGMLAGDTNNDLDGYDINGEDKIFWANDNGKFRFYLPTDFNMNGDINGEDRILWDRNNGKFSSVPRY